MSVFTGSIGNNLFKTPSGQRWALKCLSRISSDLQIRLAVKSRLILVTWNSFHVPIWRTLTNRYEMADQRLCWMHLTDEKKKNCLNFLNIHILAAMLILFHLHNTELCFYLKLVSLLRLCRRWCRFLGLTKIQYMAMPGCFRTCYLGRLVIVITALWIDVVEGVCFCSILVIKILKTARHAVYTVFSC